MTLKVCSFWAPRPEHRFYQDYTPYLNILRESCERYGHEHVTLTDDPSIEDGYCVDLPRSLMKAVLAAQYAWLSDPANASTPTLLVGADCALAQDPALHFPMDCDLAITVGNFADCRMNTGAIFIPKPDLVAEIWAKALEHCGDDWGDDQTSLYRAILERPWHGRWTAFVKELPVDPFNLAPEHPNDDCRRGVVLHFRGPRKAWMTNYCYEWLGIGEPFVAVALSNTEDSVIREQVLSAIERGLPVVGPVEEHGGHAVMVGGGPSLEDTLWEIKLRQEHGQTIFALNGTADYLAENGITPDYCVVLDARAGNARFVRSGVAKHYLLASQCHPDVFDAAPADCVTLWHAADDVTWGIVKNHSWVVRAAVTVGITALNLVYLMGYRHIHLYGYDSSHRNDEMHAYKQEETSAERKLVEGWADGQRFTTNIVMWAQAEAFKEVAPMLTRIGANLTVHGTGLLPTLARWMARPVEEELI